MKLGIAEILTKASEQERIEDRAKVLQQHDCIPLRMILKMAHDKDLKWLLPEGTPPYKPHNGHDAQGMLYSELKKMYLFIDGQNPQQNHIKQMKREALFVGLLESIDPKDAELLIAVKDKKLLGQLYKQITSRVVNYAFPGLIEVHQTYKAK